MKGFVAFIQITQYKLFWIIQSFPQKLSNVLSLQDDEVDVSYDIESLISIIPVLEVTNGIIK